MLFRSLELLHLRLEQVQVGVELSKQKLELSQVRLELLMPGLARVQLGLELSRLRLERLQVGALIRRALDDGGASTGPRGGSGERLIEGCPER